MPGQAPTVFVHSRHPASVLAGRGYLATGSARTNLESSFLLSKFLCNARIAYAVISTTKHTRSPFRFRDGVLDHSLVMRWAFCFPLLRLASNHASRTVRCSSNGHACTWFLSSLATTLHLWNFTRGANRQQDARCHPLRVTDLNRLRTDALSVLFPSILHRSKRNWHSAGGIDQPIDIFSEVSMREAW